MKVAFYGQSCLAVEIDGKSLLFDPFIRQNEMARDVDVSSIRADHLLLTRGQFDHIADAADLADRPGAPVISDAGVCDRAFRRGGKEPVFMPVGSSRGF